MKIVTRAQWGAKPWAGTPNSVPLRSRTEFFIHYDGATPVSRTGHAIMRAIEAGHRAQGWSGVGYNWVVDQAGTIYEGRGWGLQGAHCPDHNVSGLGVQIAIGGNQKPSPKALAAARALYDEACRKTGRTLARKGHKDGIATACPGPTLYSWVRAGMPAGEYKPAPTPGGSTGSGTEPIARHQTTINGLVYGYGARGAHITRTGEALVRRGFGKHYSSGPGPTWTDIDTKAYRDYQRSLGLKGTAADGVPGTASLKRLLGTLPSAAKPTPPYPGASYFGPGKSNSHIALLGTQLVARGFGKHYTSGPGPKWSDADRRNLQAFQRAQGWKGTDADGLPGPQTWRALFS
ncbi:peptidoglycan-binding protein [Streptomyces sp. NPDC093249]|uniref:peptidoglycan-binding protein n=1 Tax=unclassified Streptomyces TaxID=2593676 RepID=UPI0038280967